MAYVIGLFDDRAQAHDSATYIRGRGFADSEYWVADRDNTIKGWFERLFGGYEDAGTLQAKGVPTEDAQWFDGELNRGCTLLVVRTWDEDPQQVAATVKQGGARDARIYEEQGDTWERVADRAVTSEAAMAPDPGIPDAGTTPSAGGPESHRMPVREEQVRVGKRQRPAGEVSVKKSVDEELVHEDVPLTRERVRVERRPVRDIMSGDAQPVQEGEIRVPVTEEEVVVEKRPVVKEEVVISKEAETTTQAVDDKVKKERVDVQGDDSRIKRKAS